MGRDLIIGDWSWLVVVCPPHAALGVEATLVEAGACPLVIRRREWVKRRKDGVRHREIKETSLFGRYVIVGVKDVNNWAWLRGVRGISGVIKVDDRALIIPDQVIARLVEAEAAGEWDFTLKRKEVPVMRTGTGVRVKEGPLCGAEGELVSDAFKDGPAHALFRLFGAGRVVKIPIEQLELT